MARWGRRGLLFWLNHAAGSLRRTKTVEWGSRSSGGSPSSLWGALFAPRKKMKFGPRRGIVPVSASRPVMERPSFRRKGMRLGSRSKPLFAGIVRPASTSVPRQRAGKKRMKAASVSGSAGWSMRRPTPRKRRSTLWVIGIILFILIVAQSFVYVDRHLRIPIMNVAKVRMIQIATQAINKAITDQVAGETSFDKLIDWKTSGDGKVSGFMLNYSEHMKITAETIETVTSTLQEMEDLKEYIPVGHALGSAIISSFGPRVPVMLEPVGATQVELNTRESSIGINNTLVEVYIKVKTEISIIIPFDTEPQVVEADIPVSYLLVVGDVPMYYYDNKGNPVGESANSAPSISVPFNAEGAADGSVQPNAGSGLAPGVVTGGESAGGALAPSASPQPAAPDASGLSSGTQAGSGAAGSP